MGNHRDADDLTLADRFGNPVYWFSTMCVVDWEGVRSGIGRRFADVDIARCWLAPCGAMRTPVDGANLLQGFGTRLVGTAGYDLPLLARYSSLRGMQRAYPADDEC